jgi:hypothetical protein
MQRTGKTANPPNQAAESRNPLERMAAAGAECYRPERDLPRLLPLWPDEISDQSPEALLGIVRALRRALFAERRRARAGHWTYDLNRHLALLSAYKAEMAMLVTLKASAGAGRDPCAWRDRSGRPHSSARPSDNRAEGPTSPGTPRGRGRNASADGASKT